MNAAELYKAGRLAEAIDAQVQEVKAKPARPGEAAVPLRAARRSPATSTGPGGRSTRSSTTTTTSIAGDRRTASCSTPRRRAASSSPRACARASSASPPEHLRLRLEAVNRLREKRTRGGRRDASPGPPRPRRLSGASSTATPSSRSATPTTCSAGVLEVMAQGRYFWVGLEQVVARDDESPAVPPRPPLHPGPARAGRRGRRRLPARALSRLARASRRPGPAGPR